MRLATLAQGGRDGTLIVVSSNGQRFASAAAIAPTMQVAIEIWAEAEPELRLLSESLESDEMDSLSLDTKTLAAPLPRAWQWLDGSAYASHAELMSKVLGIVADSGGRPLMYQGVSDTFYGPHADVPMPDEALGIDFEGEFGVIVDEVPMGTRWKKPVNISVCSYKSMTGACERWQVLR